MEAVGGPAVKRQQLAKGPSDSIDSALLSAAIFNVVPQQLRQRAPAVYTTLLCLFSEFLRNRLNKNATELNRWQGRTEAVAKGAKLGGGKNIYTFFWMVNLNKINSKKFSRR